MLFSLTSRIVSALTAFLYPGYASYKTLSQRPASEADLERWLMYWSVLGCVIGVEYLAEWLVSWIPLYTTFKAIFFLYLALPQTQGSTYIYTVHLRPFFATHEGQIDMAIAEVRGRAYRFLQEKARSIWAAVIAALTSGAAQNASAGGVGGGQIDMGDQAPPQNPPGGPTQLLSSLWTSYGPGIIAGGAALLRQTAAATLPTGAASGTNNAADGRSNALNTPPGSTFFQPSAADPALERRRQLEAELASLPPYSSTSSIPMPKPIPSANNPSVRPGLTPSSSSSSVRERLNSGKFEEIKGGDIEGYKVDQDEPLMGGFVPDANANPNKPRKSAGWFSGWGSGSSAGGDNRGSYERVKSE